MKTALILLSILGIACAFSMKHFHRRPKLGDSEENGVFKFRPRYYLHKYGYFYPPLKRFAVQGSDSSEENGNGDSSDEEEEGQETSNEEENNEESNGSEDEESEGENSTLPLTTADYGEITPGTESIGLAGIQLPKKSGNPENKAANKEESDEEEEEEEEDENEENEAEVDENEQSINGTSTNSTEVENGNGSSGGDNGEEGQEESVTATNAAGTMAQAEQVSESSGTPTSLKGGLEPTPPPQEVYETTSPPLGTTAAAEYVGEYEQIGNPEYDHGYEVYENEHGEPRGDNYRAYEDEYSYYKGRGYEGYEGQDYYYHQ
ncbi:bone sialoprotein 2 [Ochotona curzoniae]|uniref:bone sialoprotein 2 n=1 Tax=Ochotona curzoniae TaxID=130825 RepID=UPI001B3531BC|nr:bone sialoprotein 2 [Ochotona curzoniae]